MRQPRTIVFFPEAAFGPALRHPAPPVGMWCYRPRLQHGVRGRVPSPHPAVPRPLQPFPGLARPAETSPYLNLLLYPQPLAYRRRYPLDPARFQYLDGCVRSEGSYEVPRFALHDDRPLLYVSFGSLGAADVDLYKRLIGLLGRLPYRALVSVGDYLSAYTDLPGNVRVEAFFPQPAVLPHGDLVVHHGGNNTFNEALYFGKPSLILPFCWDGLDNSTRVQETGYGLRLPRYTWTDGELVAAIESLLGDRAMHDRLRRLSAHMQAADGRTKAARLIDGLLRHTG